MRGLRISEDRPWVLQEYVEGSEFCTHSVVHNGRIVLHCCCHSSDFQLRYLHVEKPEILEWIEKFVAQYIFDVEDPIPFLMVNHWQIPALLFKAFLSGKPWLRIDFNIGKLVEAGGD